MDVNNPEILDTGFLPMSRYNDVGPRRLELSPLPDRFTAVGASHRADFWPRVKDNYIRLNYP
jgi:hypothetical protein